MQGKIILVQLPYQDTYYKEYSAPLVGLGILSEALIFYQIEHQIYDMQANYSLDDFCREIEKCRPTHIGFSMMTFRYLSNYKLISFVKQKFPDIQIIVGGPHITIFQEKVLEECDGVDVAVIMEGEETLIELCTHKPLEQIPGIIFRKNGSIVSNKKKDLIQNLDKHSFPKYSKFNLRDGQLISIITSRGCPYECIYCAAATTIGKKWRPRKAEKIVDELEYWVERGFSDIQILDDNFTMERRRVIDICDGIRERGIDKDINISLGNGIRADKVDEELLKIMKDSGFYQVAFGVESGSSHILKTLKKGERLDVIEKAIKIACDLDYEVHLFFVLGAPYERESDVYESIKIAKKYPVTDIAFYHLIPFPCTKLYEWVDKNSRFRFKAPDFLNDASHWVNEPLFTTEELGVDKRKMLYSLANEQGRKHTHEKINRRIAKNIVKRSNILFPLVYGIVGIARSRIIKKLIKNTRVWNKAQSLLKNWQS